MSCSVRQFNILAEMRILCLHGYMQSADIFRSKTGALRSALKKVDFVYMDAPFLVDTSKLPQRILDMMAAAKASAQRRSAQSEISNSEIKHDESSIDSKQELSSSASSKLNDDSPKDPQFSWWNMNEDASVYFDWDQSIDKIKKVFVEQGPFDGVMGFSQGGAMASILSAIRAAQPTAENPISFRFAVIFAIVFELNSMTPGRSPDLQHLFDQSLSVPSLHVYGESDVMVVPERSRALFERFSDAQVIIHPGGHFIPISAEYKKQYIEFLSKFEA